MPPALGYQNAPGHMLAAAIALLVGDRAGTLKLSRRAIRGLRWGGDRARMGLILHIITGTPAATRPDDAAIILRRGRRRAYRAGEHSGRHPSPDVAELAPDLASCADAYYRGR